MNYIEQAIELAKEEGWSDESMVLNADDEMGAFYEYRLALLDPLFWQALGKALEWDRLLEGRKWGDKESVPDPFWIRKWHRFIDHLATGKDAESFFQELLADKE